MDVAAIVSRESDSNSTMLDSENIIPLITSICPSSLVELTLMTVGFSTSI